MNTENRPTSDPDVIKARIEDTRSDLSDNVNALADNVRPSAVAHRQAERVKDGVAGLKGRVMGSGTDDDADRGRGGEAIAGVRDAVADAPSSAARTARGNPLAAGLVVFGASWLISSLLPASDAERQAAAAVKDRAAPLADTAKDAAKDVAGQLQEPAKQAVSDLKESAADSASTVKGEAQQGGQQLADSAQESASQVKDSGNG